MDINANEYLIKRAAGIGRLMRLVRGPLKTGIMPPPAYQQQVDKLLGRQLMRARAAGTPERVINLMAPLIAPVAVGQHRGGAEGVRLALPMMKSRFVPAGVNVGKDIPSAMPVLAAARSDSGGLLAPGTYRIPHPDTDVAPGGGYQTSGARVLGSAQLREPARDTGRVHNEGYTPVALDEILREMR